MRRNRQAQSDCPPQPVGACRCADAGPADLYRRLEGDDLRRERGKLNGLMVNVDCQLCHAICNHPGWLDAHQLGRML